MGVIISRVAGVPGVNITSVGKNLAIISILDDFFAGTHDESLVSYGNDHLLIQSHRRLLTRILSSMQRRVGNGRTQTLLHLLLSSKSRKIPLA